MSAELTFSVVVPTYRRHAQLELCLDALSTLDYPRDAFEVIVVDDGSDVPPETLVQQLQQRMNVSLLKQKHAGD